MCPNPTKNDINDTSVANVQPCVSRHINENGTGAATTPGSADATSTAANVEPNQALRARELLGLSEELGKDRPRVDGGSGEATCCRSIWASEVSTVRPYSRVDCGILANSTANLPLFSYLRTVRSLA